MFIDLAQCVRCI